MIDKEHLRAQEGRIEKILIQIANQYAPQILRLWDNRVPIEARCAWLGRRLADFNILVIVGEHNYSLQAINQSVENNVHQWVNGYGRLYYLLAQSLFPNHSLLTAHYTDEAWPLVIYLQGAATPIIQHLAGTVYPYICKARTEPELSAYELTGVMEEMLDQLAVTALPRTTQVELRKQGAAALNFMVKQPLDQLWLTDFDNNSFEDTGRIPPTQPTPMPPRGGPPPPPPDFFPEQVQKYLEDTGKQPPQMTGATQTLGITQPIGNQPASSSKLAAEEPPREVGDSGRVYYTRSAPVPPLPRKK